MRIAKAILGLIGTAILGLLATYIMIPEWVLMNLEHHLGQTVGGFLISAAFGGSVVFIAYATYIGWRLGDKPCRAFDDLRGIDALSGCRSLADMVEPVRDLAARAAEIAELKERASDLEDPRRKAQEQVRTPSGRLCRNMTAVRTLPTETVEAMLDAFDHDGVADLAAHDKWVRSSIRSKDGIFYLDTLFFMGQSTGEQTGRYRITDEWRKFMDDPHVLSETRSIVRSAGPVWQEL